MHVIYENIHKRVFCSLSLKISLGQIQMRDADGQLRTEKSMDDTFIKTEPHVTRKIAPAERKPKAYPGTIYFVWKHTRVTY